MLTPIRLIFLLGVAAVTPYIASETDFGRSLVTKATNLVRSESRPDQGPDQAYGGYSTTGWNSSNPVDATYANHSHYEVEKLRLSQPERFSYDEQLVRKLGGIPENAPMPSLVGSRVDDLRKVLRFDATPEKVIAHFSRVSTVLADMSLQGLRVPVVTGTEATDLAGTMTYYFDRSGKTQRISLHGFTGNPQKLVSTLTQHYELQHAPAIEAGVYMKRWNGQPVNFLRITHAPVVRTEDVHQKYTLFLELNHPNLAYGISNEARRIVAADRATGRW
ncbi:DUF6690 family protein [Planctomycetes bacterium K23_9]